MFLRDTNNRNEVIQAGTNTADLATKPEFVQFMDEVYGDLDRVDMEDDEVIEQRYNIFKNKEKAVGDLVKMYQDQMKEFVDVPTDQVKEIVERHFNKEIKENPENFQQTLENMRAYAESEKLIQQQEKVLNGFKKKYGSVEDIQAKLEVLDRAQSKEWGWKIWKGRQDSDPAAQERVQKEYKVKLENIDAEKEKLIGALAGFEQADNAKNILRESYAEVRTGFLMYSEMAVDVQRLTEDLLKEKMEKVADPDFDTPTDKLEENLKFIEKVLDTTEDEGREFYVAGNNESDYKVLRDRLAVRIRQQIEGDMDFILQNTEFGGLEKKLLPFLEKKSMGTKEIENPREFITGLLEKKVSKVTDSKKNFILRAIMKKYQYLTA
jgi:hypothetical protein